MGSATTSPAVTAVRDLLRSAAARGASDVHLEPSEGGIRVVIRQDGVLVPVELLPVELGPRIVGRLKALADLLAYRTDVPQEGRIPADRSGAGVECRVATFPTLLGERVAIRLDVPEAGPGRIADLGLPPGVEGSLIRALERPEGVILLTGPSGSGKTTTLYAGLRHVVEQPLGRSVLTIEDPIERRIEGVSQTQIQPAQGFTYAKALRSLLRQDPDVILVGEIRDAETAQITLEAGLTGHLVATTIHAGTGPQVFTRLLEMGVEPFVLTSAVRGVLAQRLLRRSDGEGGYEGRVLVAEWLPMGTHLRRAILDRSDTDAVADAARTDGGQGLQDAAARLVESGQTTAEEVQRVLGS